jgi:hypothetical protein
MADPVRSAKEAVVEIVSGLPEDSTYDEILQELVFNRMVERGLADADAGRVISDDEMKRTIDSWRDAGLAVSLGRVHRPVRPADGLRDVVGSPLEECHPHAHTGPVSSSKPRRVESRDSRPLAWNLDRPARKRTNTFLSRDR